MSDKLVRGIVAGAAAVVVVVVVAVVGRERRNAYRLLVGKPEGKRPLGRPRHKWVDSIRMYLGEVG
jgi:hypothetical protein